MNKSSGYCELPFALSCLVCVGINLVRIVNLYSCFITSDEYYRCHQCLEICMQNKFCSPRNFGRPNLSIRNVACIQMILPSKICLVKCYNHFLEFWLQWSVQNKIIKSRDRRTGEMYVFDISQIALTVCLISAPWVSHYEGKKGIRAGGLRVVEKFLCTWGVFHTRQNCSQVGPTEFTSANTEC